LTIDRPAHQPIQSTPSTTSSYDAIVIGAGIGGLTSAAMLSKAGMRVFLAEMGSRPGGYLAGFQRNGFRFETAIHWLNQCGPTGFVRKVFDSIAPGAPVTTPNSRIRRYVSESYDYLLTTNPDDLRQRLIAEYPADVKPIRAFFEAGKGTAAAFSRMSAMCRSQETMSFVEKLGRLASVNVAAFPLMRYSMYSAERGISKFFDSGAIRRVFNTNQHLLSCLVPIGWAYSNDYQLPPPGGSQTYAEWLCRVLASHGGTLACNTRVTRVSVENGRATGVTCVCDGQEIDVRARYVVAACDVESLYARMLPEGSVSRNTVRKQQSADLYNSCVTVSLGLDCPTEQFGLNEEQVQLKRDDITRRTQESEAADKAEITAIASSFRDPSLAPKGKGILTIYAPTSLGHGNYWQAERASDGGFIRGNAYRWFKKQYADTLINRVEELVIPGLRDHIEIMDIATPLTYLRYTGNRGGAIMGFRPSFRNVRNGVAHYTTPIRNLFVGGQWAELGGGMPIAVKAGANAAMLILKQEKPEEFRGICRTFDGK
jgi:prolycopene isomerase